jgi:hypothetical protein
MQLLHRFVIPHSFQPDGSILAMRTFAPFLDGGLEHLLRPFRAADVRAPPKLLRNLLVSCEDTISTNQRWIVSITGFGVAAGTIAAHQPVRSIGTPISVIVGNSGGSTVRRAHPGHRNMIRRDWGCMCFLPPHSFLVPIEGASGPQSTIQFQPQPRWGAHS